MADIVSVYDHISIGRSYSSEIGIGALRPAKWCSEALPEIDAISKSVMNIEFIQESRIFIARNEESINRPSLEGLRFSFRMTVMCSWHGCRGPHIFGPFNFFGPDINSHPTCRCANDVYCICFRFVFIFEQTDPDKSQKSTSQEFGPALVLVGQHIYLFSLISLFWSFLSNAIIRAWARAARSQQGQKFDAPSIVWSSSVGGLIAHHQNRREAN
jgi:hypothetical protein